MQAANVKKKRHSRVEIATKLAEANDLATQGKLQSEIARTLGVNVMTLHRWRKALLGVQAAVVAPHDTGQPDGTRGADNRIAELQLEISRLRRLVTDLLLGKIKFEEAAQSQTIRRVKGRHKQFLSAVVGYTYQKKLGQGCPDRCPNCKQSSPCRRSGREPWSRFALGLLFARFARFEISFDPIQPPIECDYLRS